MELPIVKKLFRSGRVLTAGTKPVFYEGNGLVPFFNAVEDYDNNATGRCRAVWPREWNIGLGTYWYVLVYYHGEETFLRTGPSVQLTRRRPPNLFPLSN